jgi:c-di-GMP-related signal transduction protein
MAFISDHLLIRKPVFNRNREIIFHQLQINEPAQDAVTPLMLRLVNIENPQSVYFVPLAWMHDAVLLEKLNKSTVLVTADPARAEQARAAGYRIAAEFEYDINHIDADFRLLPFGSHAPLTPDSITVGIATTQQFETALAGGGILFSADAGVTATSAVGSKRINPAHALILELMSAVQQEADAKAIELMFKRDIALSFKLLRYINSPGFGLASRVDSIRHALSILGYRQLLKWLSLLAATAGQTASPALTQTAITRARLMELLGAKRLEKRDADNLFMTGMLSMLDRIIGLPLTDILSNANLPPAINEALLHGSGKYLRFLQLAQACEGSADIDEASLSDIDAKTANIAHLEAIEWATQICADSAA